MVIPRWFCVNGSLGTIWRNTTLYLCFAEIFLLFPQPVLCNVLAVWIFASALRPVSDVSSSIISFLISPGLMAFLFLLIAHTMFSPLHYGI